MTSRHHIAAFETTSLSNKFKSLWLAGIEAKLTFETRAGQAWGTLEVCLGEHPVHLQQPQQQPPHQHLQEVPQRHESPCKQRRRERREAAREAAAIAAGAEIVAEEAIDTETENISDKHQTIEEEALVEKEVAEEAAEHQEYQQSLFITDIDDEICDDERYYDEIDPETAFTCLQCNMEYFLSVTLKGIKWTNGHCAGGT